MLFHSLLALFGGVGFVVSAAVAQLPRDVGNETCSAGPTVTAIQTVTLEPQIIVISAANPNEAASSIVYALTHDTSVPVSAYSAPVSVTSTVSTEAAGTETDSSQTTETYSVASETSAYTAPIGPGDTTSTYTNSAPTTVTISVGSATPVTGNLTSTSNSSTVSSRSSSSYILSTSTITALAGTTTEVITTLLSISTSSNISTGVSAIGSGSSCSSSVPPYTSIVVTTLTTTVTGVTPSTVSPSTTSNGAGNSLSVTSTTAAAVSTSSIPSSFNTSASSFTTITISHNQTTTSVVTVSSGSVPVSNNTTTSGLTITTTALPTTSVTAYGYQKRSVCELVTATMSDGTVITFPNAWDGTSYVPTCSVPPLSSETSSVGPATTTSESSPSTIAPTTVSSTSTPSGSGPVVTATYGPPVPSSFGSSTDSAPSSLTTVTSSTSSLVSPVSSETSSGYSSSTLSLVPGIITETVFPLPESSTMSSVPITSSLSPSFTTSIVETSSQASNYFNATSAPTSTVQATSTVSNSTSTSAAPTSTQSCGETGTFNITFDDLPTNGAPSQLPPIFSPYDHFGWSQGWSYLPPPTDQFLPQGGSHLGIYTPPAGGSQPSLFDNFGYFGGGFVAPTSDTAYWFDAQMAYAACDNGPWNNGTNNGTEECIITANGYHYNVNATDNEILVADFTFSIPGCQTMTDCTLTPIIFDNQFVELSTIAFQATVGKQVVSMYFDTFTGTWWNNTCAAGNERASTR